MAGNERFHSVQCYSGLQLHCTPFLRESIWCDTSKRDHPRFSKGTSGFGKGQYRFPCRNGQDLNRLMRLGRAITSSAAKQHHIRSIRVVTTDHDQKGPSAILKRDQSVRKGTGTEQTAAACQPEHHKSESIREIKTRCSHFRSFRNAGACLRTAEQFAVESTKANKS